MRESEHQFFERFAREGYDVYLYEQAGTGRSDPLRDLRDYTVQRNVDDLEAIRRTIGAERLILIGQSWGAILAAHYTADHPQRVAKLIFPSPGPMRHADQVRIDASRTAAARADMTPPLRVMAAWYFAEVNPGLAANFAPPQEMNSYMGSVAPRLMRQSYCAGDAASVPRVDGAGFNFYANRLTQQDLELPFRSPSGVAPGLDADPGDEGRMRLRPLAGGPRLRVQLSQLPDGLSGAYRAPAMGRAA